LERANNVFDRNTTHQHDRETSTVSGIVYPLSLLGMVYQHSHSQVHQ